MANNEKLSDDEELFFDMDLSVPPHLQDHGSISNEFEFARAFPSIASSSPADHLFFKGQLLPLHSPLRLRMVEILSSSSRVLAGHHLSLLALSCSSQRDDSGYRLNRTYAGSFDAATSCVHDKFEQRMTGFCNKEAPNVNLQHVKMHAFGSFKWKGWKASSRCRSFNKKGEKNECESKLTEENVEEHMWLKLKLVFQTLGKQKVLPGRKQMKGAAIKDEMDSSASSERFDPEIRGAGISKAKDYVSKYVKGLKLASASLLSKITIDKDDKECEEGRETERRAFRGRSFRKRRIHIDRRPSSRWNGDVSSDEKSQRMQMEMSAIQAAIAHCKLSQTSNKNIHSAS